MTHDVNSKQLRSFGLTVGGIFAVIAVWPLVLRGDDPRWWAVTVAGLLILPALVFPTALSWAYKRWMALGHILGWVNTRIILGFIFYGVVTPIGALRRLLGKDAMGKQIRPGIDTYRIVRQSRPPSHLKRQY